VSAMREARATRDTSNFAIHKQGSGLIMSYDPLNTMVFVSHSSQRGSCLCWWAHACLKRVLFDVDVCVQGPAPNAPMGGGKPKRPIVASALFNMMANPHLNPNSFVPPSIPSHIPRDDPPSPEPAAAAAATDRDKDATLMALTPVVRPFLCD
jgi:hypothetical protein